MFAGGVKLGALLVTVTVNEPLAVRPPLSVTVQLTVVVPIGKVDPDSGLQTAAIGPCSASLPLALNVHRRAGGTRRRRRDVGGRRERRSRRS